MEKFRKFLLPILILTLVIGGIFIWREIYVTENNTNLKVYYLDVGQGDSIFIEAPNGYQILIDGGPDKKVLRKLSEVMPFYDRTIDAIIVSHSDKDHIGGLPFVLKNYKVGKILESGNTSTSKVYAELENLINTQKISLFGFKKQKTEKILARTGQKIILDQKNSIHLDILFPDRDVSDLDSNESSVVAKLIYGNESFLFTGDSPKITEAYMFNHYKNSLQASVLKLAHHGSKTSSSELFLESVNPQYAVISSGKNNSYGHPHKETLDRLQKRGINYFNTADVGTIEFETDGEILKIK
ncbi:MAG: ComEC/Rec2 family competence protein [Candidatus Paceibacterota bacterium]|jgi:competence protein ComEC